MALPLAAIYIGMQAAGLVLNYKDTKSKQEAIRYGRSLDKAAFEMNMQAIRLESNQQSLDEMVELRKNLGTQMATFAARGTAIGTPATVGFTQESIGTFNKDEAKRRLNLLAKEANLRASNVLSGLHTYQSETELGQKFTSSLLDSLPISSAVDFFTKSGKPKSSKSGFGLEEI